jgi:hypothetical protein
MNPYLVLLGAHFGVEFAIPWFGLQLCNLRNKQMASVITQFHGSWASAMQPPQ